MHSALKEWILSLPEQLSQSFKRLEIGLIGDLKPFEAKPPLMRLGMARGQVTLNLCTDRRMTTTENGASSHPLKFLFIVLWACRELKQTRINLGERREARWKFHGVERTKAALHVPLPSQVDLIVEKIQDRAKKINKDWDIRRLQQALTDARSGGKARKATQPRAPFISVSARSAIGSQVEVWFPDLPLDELDWDEAMCPLVTVPR